LDSDNADEDDEETEDVVQRSNTIITEADPDLSDPLTSPTRSGEASTSQQGNNSGEVSNSSERAGTSSGGVSASTSSEHVTHSENQAESSRNLPRERVWNRDHPSEQIIGDPASGVTTRR
jgi:hypothetical protein